MRSPVTSKLLIDTLGAAAAIASTVSFAPQVLKIWRDKDARGVSLRMYGVSVGGFCLWTTYGVLIGQWPVVACNAICLGLCATILALKWRFSRGRGVGTSA
jgi:MtN3 and saliva related transmembrane protein